MTRSPRTGARSARAILWAFLLAAAITPAGASAQSGDDGGLTPSAYVEPGHWARTALRRLDALGLLPPGGKPGDGPVTRAEVAALFEHAVDAAPDPATRTVASRYRALFCQELPDACEPPRTWSGVLGGSRVSVGYTNVSGRLLTAEARLADILTPPTPPEPAGDVSTLGAVADASLVTPWLAARGRVRTDADGTTVEEAYLAGQWGGLGAWAGRRRLGFGYGRQTLVLQGRVAVDGAGIQTAPFRLPWALRHLGVIRFSTGLFRTDYSAPYREPWLLTTRGSITPVPWFTLGATRAAMVVVEGDDGATRLRRALEVFIGMHTVENTRDNQVASLDVRLRVPSDQVPLVVFGEWGVEDSAGAWFDVPGVIWGLYLGAVPGLEAAALGFQHTSMPRSCCGNPPWYRHAGFAGGWTDQRTPLGHSLGGHGTEWRGWSDLVLRHATATLELFGRRRGSENLYAPERVGFSRGAAVLTMLRPGASLELGGRLSYERGNAGWDETRAEISLSYLF